MPKSKLTPQDFSDHRAKISALLLARAVPGTPKEKLREELIELRKVYDEETSGISDACQARYHLGVAVEQFYHLETCLVELEKSADFVENLAKMYWDHGR